TTLGKEPGSLQPKCATPGGKLLLACWTDARKDLEICASMCRAGEGLTVTPHRPLCSVAIRVRNRCSSPGQYWLNRRLKCPLSRPSTSPSPSKSQYQR